MDEKYRVNLIRKKRAGGRISTDNGSFTNVKIVPEVIDCVRPAIGKITSIPMDNKVVIDNPLGEKNDGEL